MLWLIVVGRKERRLKLWLCLLLLISVHSRVVAQRYGVRHSNWLRWHPKARERHQWSRRRESAHRLLYVLHKLLIGLRYQVRIHVRVGPILRHLSWMHRKHGCRHRSSLERDMGSAVWRSTILEMGRLEHDALAVAFAVSFRFNAVLAHRAFFAALDATFATCQTSSLGPFA